MKKEEVEKILLQEGFELGDSSAFGEQYYLSLGNDWKVSAYCSFHGNPFAGDAIDKESYEDINISLSDSIGTNFEFEKTKSLKENLSKVIQRLKENSDDDDILKCPKCKVRYVQIKKPRSGQKWKPFLSCSGMIIKGSGRNKGVICDGTSKKIPALIKL